LTPYFFRRKFDIVNMHSQNPLAKLFVIFGNPRVIVQTDHGTSLSSPVRRKQRVVLASRVLSPFFDHYIAVSNSMRRSLEVREKIPSHKITQIYNGVDVHAISKVCSEKSACLKRSLSLEPSIPVLGTIGRLAPEKEYPLLLKSLSLLKKQGRRFITLIVGDGPDKSILQYLITRMGLNGNVLMLGERNDAIDLIELFDVFLFTSSGEAFPITLLEAMAKAKPIVAFDVEGVNEAVLNDHTGFLVPFGDVEGLAEKAMVLVESRDLAAQMGKRALNLVSARFNLKTNIRMLEDLYNSLLGGFSAFRIR